MDIQLASNFERLLFELAGRDSGKVRARMEELRKTGAFHLQPRELEPMRALFACHAIGEHETETTIRTLYEETGQLIDPHTAVGVAASRKERGSDPMIVLSTAHAAKFPDAVKRATGRLPEAPERLKARLGQEERLTVLANDYGKVASFILNHARAKAPASVKSAGGALSGVRA
jgi:threonine synthase